MIKLQPTLSRKSRAINRYSHKKILNFAVQNLRGFSFRQVLRFSHQHKSEVDNDDDNDNDEHDDDDKALLSFATFDSFQIDYLSWI